VSFLARLDLIRRLKAEGLIHRWGALVTADFFNDESLIRAAKEAGCYSLFSGLESFDTATLRRFNKKQNTLLPQVAAIERSLEAGIVFNYGLMADLYRRRISEIREEIEYIVSNPRITLPSFVTLPIPLLGTPYFRECARSQRLLPNVRLRDMEGSVLVMETLDPLGEAAAFVCELQSFSGYRLRMARHAAAFIKRYRSKLPLDGLFLATTGVGLLGLRALTTAPRSAIAHTVGRRPPARTHVASSERLDALYRPPFRIDARWAENYEPLMVTDGAGRVTDTVAEEALGRIGV